MVAGVINMKREYIINKETISLISEFDNFGKENTRAIEGKNMFLVNKSPEKIINDTLNYLGSSLEGAIIGSKSILGNIYRVPISISAKQGITWFPCNSCRPKESIWLAHSHIENLEKLNSIETIVHMSHGHSLNISMRKKQIEDRMGRAALLQTKLVERSTKKMLFLYEKGSGIKLYKRKGEINFVNDKEKVD